MGVSVLLILLILSIFIAGKHMLIPSQSKPSARHARVAPDFFFRTTPNRRSDAMDS